MNQIDCKCKKIEGVSRAVLLLILVYFFSILQGFGAALFLECMLVLVPVAAFYTSFCSDVLGNMQSKRRKKGQFKNVLLIRRNMSVIMVFFGVVFGVTLFFTADKIAAFLGADLAVSSLKLMSPIFFLLAIETGLAAYFKGNGIYMPVAASSIVRPISLLGFGILLMGKGMEYGNKVARFLGAEEKAYIYGCGALCLAILITECIVVLLNLVLYFGSNHGKDRRKSPEGTRLSENVLDVIRNYFSAAFGPIMGMILLAAPIIIGMKKMFSDSSVESITATGGFFGAFMIIPLLVYVLMFPKAYALRYKLSGIKKIQDYKRTKRSMEMISMFSVRIGIYVTILCLIVAPYLAESVFGYGGNIAINIWNIGLFSLLPICISIVSLEMLEAEGKRSLKSWMIILSGAAEIVCLFLLSGKDMQLAIAVAFLIGMSLLMVMSLGYLMIRRFFQVNVIYMFVVPMISGAFTGLILILALKLMAPHIGASVSVIVGIILSLLIYFGILSAVKNITSHEIKFLYEKSTQKFLGLFIK